MHYKWPHHRLGDDDDEAEPIGPDDVDDAGEDVLLPDVNIDLEPPPTTTPLDPMHAEPHPAHEEGLPGLRGWRRCMDNTTQASFYYNEAMTVLFV